MLDFFCTRQGWRLQARFPGLAGAALLIAPYAFAATSSINNYFPHLAVGGGFQTTLTYENYSTQSVSCETTFYSDTGAALQVPFADVGTVASRTDTLGPGADIHVQTQATAPSALLAGWAVGQCTGPVKASLLYRYYSGGVAQGEASVSATNTPTAEFVSFAQTQTGIAYANPSPTAATITVTALDSTGKPLGKTSLTLQPNAHGAANVGPLLGLGSFTGSVQISSTVPIVSLALNAEAFPVFSSLPPGDLPAGTPLSIQSKATGASAAPGSYYFPHLAVGSGFQTTLTYVNYSTQSVSCETTFYADTGAALQVPFADVGTVSSRTDTLGPGADIHVQTQATAGSGLLAGWAVGQCTGPVKASLLYRYYRGGVPQGEASVAAMTTPTTEFASFAQTQTGIAYANPSPTPATINVTALDSTGRPLGNSSLTLQPNAHGAANVAPLLGLSPFTGSVQISSTVPIVGLALNAEAFPVFSSLPPGDLPAGTPLGSAQPWVTITSIWSNQLGNGVIANYLPDGAGIEGNAGGYILMGTASDGTIRAGASLQVPSGVDTSGLTVRLEYIDPKNGTPTTVGTGTLESGIASLTVDPTSFLPIMVPGVLNFDVVAFQDSNGNGRVDPGEKLARYGWFRVITPSRYLEAQAVFTGGAVWGYFNNLPNASALLAAFVFGTTPNQATRSDTTVYTSQLSHSVGTLFTTGRPSASGTIPQYTFPSSSNIAKAVLQSNEFKRILVPAAEQACLLPASAPVSLNVEFGADDPDLKLAFHTATLSGVTLTQSPGQATFSGTLSKLYNWNFDGADQSPNGELYDPMGASLQAGFPAMGTFGVIFSAVVKLDGLVQVPPCSLAVSPPDPFAVSGQQGSISGSTTYTLQDTGSYPIAFAASVDVPWLTVSAATGNLQPNGSAAITVSTNAAANSLAAGSYTGTITFSSGATTITRSATLSVTNSSQTPPPPSVCEVVTQGPYSFRVVNLLSTDALVYFGDVTLPDGTKGSLSFGAQMHSGECDIIELPEIANYSVDISRSDSDGNQIGTVVPNSLTFSDTSSGFIFDLVTTYTVVVTNGNCSAPTTFAGQPAYSVCVP